MSLQLKLVDLLSQTFSAEEFRRFLVTSTDAGLVDELPTPGRVGKREYLVLAVEALNRRRLLGPEFFAAWVGKRPKKADEIRSLQQQLGIHSAAEVAAAPPTAKTLRLRLVEHFSVPELHLLVATFFPEVRGGFDAIVSPVHPLEYRAHQLVMYCKRRGWLDRLVAAIAEERAP